MPATSVFLRHILPHVSRLLSKPISYLSKRRNPVLTSPSHSPLVDSSENKRLDRMHGPYRSMKDWELATSSKGSNDLELVSTQAVKTNVVALPSQAYNPDRIHVKVDLEQG